MGRIKKALNWLARQHVELIDDAHIVALEVLIVADEVTDGAGRRMNRSKSRSTSKMAGSVGSYFSTRRRNSSITSTL